MVGNADLSVAGEDDLAATASKRDAVIPLVAVRAVAPVPTTHVSLLTHVKVKPRPDRLGANTKKDPRCRRCGRLKQSDPVAAQKHGNRVSRYSLAFCTVNAADYKPGYPKHGYECKQP